MSDPDDVEVSARARRAKRSISQDYVGKDSVTGAGLRQDPKGSWTVIVYVTEGEPGPENLPGEIDGFAVQVERIGPIKPLEDDHI